MASRRYLRFKPWKPGDPDPAPRTEAQRKAHHRTWGIVQLRSLWCLACHVRTPWRLRLIRWLIDGELKARGAEPHNVRVKRQEIERDAAYARLEAEQQPTARIPPTDYDLDEISF